MPRADDFEGRRRPLQDLTDEELRARFWDLTEQVVAPLVDEARHHTTPAIERSVLLRMGLSSVEAKATVDHLHAGGLLGRGAGRIVLELSQRHGVSLREAGVGLVEGRYDPEPAR